MNAYTEDTLVQQTTAEYLEQELGSVANRFEHFHEWKRLAENQPGVVAMETLLKGVCAKANFLDLVENFIVFDDSAGESRKILAAGSLSEVRPSAPPCRI